MLKLKSPIGTNYRIEPNDLMNTKRALNQLGYYDIPPDCGFDDWTDDAMFDGIKRFQKANGLKVDAFMRPGGPTETAMNKLLQRSAFGPPRAVDLSSMQQAAMCSCTSSDDNPHRDRPDPYE